MGGCGVSAPRRHWTTGLKAAEESHVGLESSLQNKASRLRSDMADVHIRQRQSPPLSPRSATITQTLIGALCKMILKGFKKKKIIKKRARSRRSSVDIVDRLVIIVSFRV